MDDYQKPDAWQETTGSGQQLAQRSESSLALEAKRNLYNLTPASATEITIAVAPCLALVGGIGMGDDGRTEWLRAATETLRDIPNDLLHRGCAAARLRADHPSKIIPAIMADVGDTWEWRRARKSAPLDNRNIPPAKQICTPEEASEIAKRYKVGSFAMNRQVSDPHMPSRVPTTSDPERPCRAPTREDYIRLGVDPAILEALDADRAQASAA